MNVWIGQFFTIHQRVMALEANEPTLCFFGALTTLGNEACVGELQSRWAVAALTGKAAQALRIAEDTAASAAQRRKIADRSPLFPQFANYVTYCDGLAQDIGCAPPPLSDVYYWIRRPALWWRMWQYPVVPTQYRLRGAGRWDGAEDYIRSRL